MSVRTAIKPAALVIQAAVLALLVVLLILLLGHGPLDLEREL
jgi:hypothetical protein